MVTDTLKKKLKKQNPIMMSPMVFALAACGGGDEGIEQDTAAKVANIIRLTNDQASYVGDTDYDKLIIDSDGINNLPVLYFPNSDEPEIVCAMPAPPPFVRIQDGNLFVGVAEGCWGGYSVSAEYKSMEVVEIDLPLTGQFYYALEGITLLLGWSSDNSPLAKLSFLSNGNAVYIHQIEQATVRSISPELDQLILAGPIQTDLNFDDGSHVIVIESEDVFTSSIEVANFGADDQLILAMHLLTLDELSSMIGIHGKEPTALTKFAPVSDIISASQVIIDSQENILSADLSELISNITGSGLLALTNDTAKLLFDADGDFTEGTIEVLVFSDGVLPSVTIEETNYIL